ncbi:hypothetical protein OG21DRAFT_972179 [Imleria badia]|nr:hypothetical protein OG21DRAFT_972179 [Imleria badia]
MCRSMRDHAPRRQTIRWYRERCRNRQDPRKSTQRTAQTGGSPLTVFVHCHGGTGRRSLARTRHAQGPPSVYRPPERRPPHPRPRSLVFARTRAPGKGAYLGSGCRRGRARIAPLGAGAARRHWHVRWRAIVTPRKHARVAESGFGAGVSGRRTYPGWCTGRGGNEHRRKIFRKLYRDAHFFWSDEGAGDPIVERMRGKRGCRCEYAVWVRTRVPIQVNDAGGRCGDLKMADRGGMNDQDRCRCTLVSITDIVHRITFNFMQSRHVRVAGKSTATDSLVQSCDRAYGQIPEFEHVLGKSLGLVGEIASPADSSHDSTQ